MIGRLGLALGVFTYLCLGIAAAEEEPVLNIYNWTDYITDTALEGFETEFGIKINYDTYDNVEIVNAKLLAGKSGYDVVFHSSLSVAQFSPIGIFLPLDRSKLPNWKNLDQDILDQVSVRDPGNRFATPYMWGTVGNSFNLDMVLERVPDAPLNSNRMMFDPEIVSKLADCGVTFLDSPDEVIPLALMYNGLDGNSLDPADLAKAEATLRAVRPYIKYFGNSRLLQDLPAKEVCMAGSWSGDYAQAWDRAKEAGIDIRLDYQTPVEGSPVWYDLIVIPSDAEHPDNAHKFLNYLMRPEVIGEITNLVNYANANPPSRPFVRKDILENDAIYPPKEVMDNTYLMNVPTLKEERLRTRLWARIKSGL